MPAAAHGHAMQPARRRFRRRKAALREIVRKEIDKLTAEVLIAEALTAEVLIVMRATRIGAEIAPRLL